MSLFRTTLALIFFLRASTTLTHAFTSDYFAAETTVGGFYGNGYIPKTYHTNWMQALPDAMLISEISIPGTHDTGTESTNGAFGSSPAVCQDALVLTQLMAGVRSLDLRIRRFGNEWLLYHQSPVVDYEFRPFPEVMAEIHLFLSLYPSETVLVRLSADRDEDRTQFQTLVYPTILAAYPKTIWQQPGTYRADGVTPAQYAHAATGKPPDAGGWDDADYDNSSYQWPTLGEVRGKMVMFVNPNRLLEDNTGLTWGLGHSVHWDAAQLFQRRPQSGEWYSSSRDQYGNTDLGNKQTGDVFHILLASNSADKKILYSTGLNVGWHANMDPISSAIVMNRWLLNWLNNVSEPALIKRTGIVIMDFPGPGILDSIIARNFRYTSNASQLFPSFYQYATRLPFEDNLNFEYQAAWQARAWRRQVKERIPSAEFNTFIAKGSIGGFTSTISATNTHSLSTAAALNKTLGVLFQSHHLPPLHTTNEVQTLLNSVIATNSDVNIIKQRFDNAYPDHQWTVFSYSTAGLPTFASDFDANVVSGSHVFWNGVLFAQWVVAGSRKPGWVSAQESTRSVVGHWELPYPDTSHAMVGRNLSFPVPQSHVALPGAVTLPITTSGIEIGTESASNGGPSAIRMHQWSLILDLKLLALNRSRSLIQIDSLNNSTEGELFINASGGIGIGEQYYGSLKNDIWHRVVVAVDATREELMSVYIDGNHVGDIKTRTFTASGDVVSGYTYTNVDRWSLMERTLLFTDNKKQSGNMLVGGIQLRNYKMSQEEVAKMGGASDSIDVIPNDDKKVSIDLAGKPELQVVNPAGFRRMVEVSNQVRLTWKPGETLQSGSSAQGPFYDIPRFGISEVPGVGNREIYYPNAASSESVRFYRVK